MKSSTMIHKTSIATTLKLKKNGFPQKTESDYIEWSLSSKGKRHITQDVGIPSLAIIHKRISSPCACEILIHLPESIPDSEPPSDLVIRKFKHEWHVEYPKYHTVIDDNLADACGNMWLWLRRNYIIWC